MKSDGDGRCSTDSARILRRGEAPCTAVTSLRVGLSRAKRIVSKVFSRISPASEWNAVMGKFAFRILREGLKWGTVERNRSGSEASISCSMFMITHSRHLSRITLWNIPSEKRPSPDGSCVKKTPKQLILRLRMANIYNSSSSATNNKELSLS